MQLSFSKKILGGLIFTLLLIALLGTIATRAIQNLSQAFEAASHTQLILRKTNLLADKLSIAEENYANYLATNDHIYYAGFSESIKTYTSDIEELKSQVSSTVDQKKQVDSLEKYSSLRLALLKEFIKNRKKEGLYAQQSSEKSKGFSYREESKKAIEDIRETERTLLKIYNLKSSQKKELVISTIIICTVVGLGLICLLFLYIYNTIKAKERVQEELHSSQSKFGNSFNYSGIGQAIVSPTGAWINVNRELCSMLGYSEEELLKLTFQQITHPEDLDADLENVGKVLSGEIHSYSMEKRYLNKLGKIVCIF